MLSGEKEFFRQTAFDSKREQIILLAALKKEKKEQSVLIE